MLLESFCVVSSLWHIVVALCLNVGSLCDHWRGGSSHCSSVCVDSTSPWTLSFCLSGGGEFCSANQPCNPPPPASILGWLNPPTPTPQGLRGGAADWWLSQRWSQTRKGKGSGVVAYAQHPPRQSGGGNKKRGGGGAWRWEGTGGLPSSQDAEWAFMVLING